MSDRTEVNNKLLAVIKEVILSNPDMVVPACVEDRVLESYGWTVEEKNTNFEGLDNFIRALETITKNSSLPTKNKLNYLSKGEIYSSLKEDFEKYVEVETEYLNIVTRLIQVAEELISRKETCSHQFKNKCKLQECKMEVLVAKLEFLKNQLLSKLYREENAMNAHLKLKDYLTNELESLQRCLSETLALNSQYDELIKNEIFIRLSKEYKELKEKENLTRILSQE